MPSTDKLLLRGLRLYGRHGVLASEKSLGQQFLIDVEVQADLSSSCSSDRFEDAIDYVKVFNIAQVIVQGPPSNLVEKVANDIACGILKDINAAKSVKVRVVKPCVALPAVLDGIGVEIERSRE